MTDSTQTFRLKKVATELNVGVHTIVEFLKKKGITIEDNPNAKVSPEAHILLTKEFNQEKNLKEESKKMAIFSQKKDNSSPEKNKELNLKSIEKEKKLKENDIFAPIEEIKVKVDEAPKLKILGKIDVENPVKKVKTEDNIETPIEKKMEKVEEKIEKVVEKHENLVAEKIIEKNPVIEKTDNIETIEKVITKQPIDEPKIKVLGKIDINKHQHTEKPKEKVKEVVKENPKVEVKEEPKVENQIKQDFVEEVKTETTKVEDSTKEETPDNFLKTTYQKLDGPTILGKMVLPTAKDFSKKQPIATSSDALKANKKKKRKRIKKEGEGNNTNQNNNQQNPQNRNNNTPGGNQNNTNNNQNRNNQQGTGNNNNNQNRNNQQGTGNNNNNQNRNNQQGTGNNNNNQNRNTQQGGGNNLNKGPQQTGGFKKPENKFVKKPFKKEEIVKPEITDEEIQRQIKETLARLSGAGKSKASKYRRQKRDQHSQNKQEEIERIEGEKNKIKVTEFVTANELANMMGAQVTQVISTCLNLGIFVSINQRLDAETIVIVADEFGYDVEFVSAEVQDAIKEDDDNEADLITRSPIVTVMGHVDHGKTSLLDYVRKTNVISGESGGITQHIGAYTVKLENGKTITFLDTPGHEAFTAMRARGAKITDISIIVVAADDSVKPQTIEAINHALAANVPIIIAINKIDKPQANSEKVREELAKLNILVEEWGGKYQCQEISAKKGTNIDILLEKILIEAEMLELKANPKRKAAGTVVESSLDKGRGFLSTILVQKGTLKIGDIVLAGCHFGKVKAMFNERNTSMNEAGPSQPVLILGLNGAPQAGDVFHVMTDEQEAKNIANKRLQLQREQGLRTQKHITLDEIGRRIAIGDFKELNIIVKGDVDGSIEALSDSLLKLSNSEVQVNIIHKSVGSITESDVLLASASNAIIVGFQVRPSPSARKLAEQEEIDIRMYSIIYNAINEIKSAIEGMLSPDIEEKIICNIAVRETFKITKVGTIAGCMVLDGKVTRQTKIRLIRDGIVIYTGNLGSLKRFKDDVKEVATGYECGLNIDNFNDIKEGDIIEGYEIIETKRKL